MKLINLFSERYLSSMYVALEAVLANKLRSLLTALGIIFGVAAVIAMLAIGNGAQQELLEQIKLVGVNNIVVTPIVPQTEEEISEDLGAKEKEKFSPGLTVRDVNGLIETIPTISKVSPEIVGMVSIKPLTSRTVRPGENFSFSFAPKSSDISSSV